MGSALRQWHQTKTKSFIFKHMFLYITLMYFSRWLVYLLFLLNGFMPALCRGREFALLTAGPFDVLLQPLPIVVSSLLICFRLSPSSPSLSLSVLCLSWPLVSPSWWIHTCARIHTGVEMTAEGFCCLSNNETHLTFLRCNFASLTPSLVPGASWLL